MAPDATADPIQNLTRLQWDKFIRLASYYITDQRGKYMAMLEKLRPDIREEKPFRIILGMERAPAATERHHAREGGLVEHMLEMWETYLQLTAHTSALRESEHINTDRVFRAIVNHDLHKAYRTYLRHVVVDGGLNFLHESNPWQVSYHKEDPTNRLMTEDHKSLWILSQHGVMLDPEMMNAHIYNLGGFTRDKPFFRSALACLLSEIDEFSGNVLEQARKGTWLDPLENQPDRWKR